MSFTFFNCADKFEKISRKVKEKSLLFYTRITEKQTEKLQKVSTHSTIHDEQRLCAVGEKHRNRKHRGFILMRDLACIHSPYRSVFIQRLMKSDVVKKVTKTFIDAICLDIQSQVQSFGQKSWIKCFKSAKLWRFEKQKNVKPWKNQKSDVDSSGEFFLFEANMWWSPECTSWLIKDHKTK